MVLRATVQRQSSKQPLPKVSSKAFFKIRFLKDFPAGKHPCWSLFSNKIENLKVRNFNKRDFDTGVSCEYCEIV